MASSGNAMLERIIEAFANGEFEDVQALVKQGLDSGLGPREILDEGLTRGIREVGEQFRRGEVYLPEMLLSADAWESAMDLLKPLLGSDPLHRTKGKVVIGTVKGDIHSLGKNIVHTLLSMAGFEVFDLGVDVPASRFAAKARETGSDIIALCALMTTTMPQQGEVIEHLLAANMRDEVFVMVGGACTTPEWAARIKADAHGETAADAVALAEGHIKALARS